MPTLPSIHKWPKGHRILGIVSIVLGVAMLAYGLARLYPLYAEYKQTQDEAESLRAKLATSTWPQDPTRLLAIHKDYLQKLGAYTAKRQSGLLAQSARCRAQAMAVFQERINAGYGDQQIFMEKASQTEYKDQYDRLHTELKGKRVFLTPDVFGMNEATSEPQKYLMLLKLWTTKALTDRVFQTGLTIVTDKKGNQFSSRITARPIREYILSVNEKAPYLQEIPIQMEVEGTMEQLHAFFSSLYGPDCFLPVVQLELRTMPPPLQTPPNQNRPGKLTVKKLRARIVCSGFFLPSKNSKAPSPALIQKTLPPGA